MKRLFSFFIVCQLSAGLGNAQIYVSPDGNDAADGSIGSPKASVQAALRQLRENRRLNPSISTGHEILVNEGTYYLKAPLIIRPEDNGNAEHPTVIKNGNGKRVVLSGGAELKNWRRVVDETVKVPLAARGKLYEAALSDDVFPDNFNFRQLWINGKKATRAKSATGPTMHRILNWDKKTATAVIPLEPFPKLSYTPGMEFFIHQWWEIASLRVKRLEKSGDSFRVHFYEPESTVQNEHPWPAPWLSKETGNSAFYLENALQFLDEPGEWYFDKAKRKIYYYPLPNENMQTAEVVVPMLENLLILQGTPEKSVTNIIIEGLSFEHSSWLRQSQSGHVPHQAGMYMTEAYKLRPAGTKEKPSLDNQAWIGRPEAAVVARYARGIKFQNNSFQHLAATGLDLQPGSKQIEVQGNLFKDIGGTALQGGYYGEHGLEVHLPYLPKDANAVVESILVKNNFVTDAGNEDWGCVGIGFGYARKLKIENNEIENIPYSGISVGWGWTPAKNVMEENNIRFNKIHHYGRSNYDCAGIYTLSAQPGSHIEGNYIDSIFKAPYAHLPTHWFYLYTDEGSSGISVKNNWTPSLKFLQNNNGPNNTWANNGPNVSAMIKRTAGLEKPYQHLVEHKTSDGVHQAINKERREIIELEIQSAIDVKKLQDLLNQKGARDAAVYQWKNRIVIYGFFADIGVLAGQIKKAFEGVRTKVYYDQVYDFERAEKCGVKSVAKEWTHIIMTANLVEDIAKQQGYTDDHKTQFEKWPEVSKGFCNANFQQLQVLRNGRQLMLIISIPKGKTLDELNPKTVENNPRVNEWNKRMSQYQEGIEGTSKGEVWVELKKASNR